MVKRLLITALLFAASPAHAQVSYGAQSFRLHLGSLPSLPSGDVAWYQPGTGQAALVDSSGNQIVNFNSTSANNASIDFADGSSAAVSASGQARLAYDSGLQALKLSLNGGAFVPLLASGNWTFSGNNTDLLAPGTMGLCLGTCTAFSLGNNTVTNAILNVTQLQLQAGGTNKLIWSNSLNALYPVTDNSMNLGQSGNRYAIIYGYQLTTGGIGQTLTLNQQFGSLALVGITNITSGAAAAANTSAADAAWNVQTGGASDGTAAGGNGANWRNTCGTGGAGSGTQNPGNGGDCTWTTGSPGAGGGGNANSGNFNVAIPAAAGTGSQGAFIIKSGSTSKLVGSLTLSAWYPVTDNAWTLGLSGNRWSNVYTEAVTSGAAADLTVTAGGTGRALTLTAPSGTLALTAPTITFTAGTIANAALANSSVTVSTTSPLGGGGAVSLGGSLTLTCSSCLTGTPTTTGDLMYSTSGGQAFTPLHPVASGQVLASAGTSTAPAYTATPTVTSVTVSEGTGTQTGIVPATSFTSTTVTGSSTGGATNTLIFSMPANTLSANGMWLEWAFTLTHAANTDACTFTATFAGTTIGTSAFATSSGVFTERIQVQRLTTTTARSTVLGWGTAGSITNAGVVALSGLDFTSIITLQVTLPATTANNDCSSESAHIAWFHN
jgi:hypothetical protein